MKKGLTELVFILDRSGSMSGLEPDTIGGFNSLIRKQKDVEGEALVSLVLFNHESEVIYDRVPIKHVESLTERQYYACGSTALLDAVGDAIHHIGNVHKYAREEDVPEKTMVVITTDGMENASYKFTVQQIKNMIEHEKTKYGWEFLFLGANIDAVGVAQDIGIDAGHASNYCQDEVGVELNFKCFNTAVTSLRERGKVDASWCEETRAYYEKDNQKR